MQNLVEQQPVSMKKYVVIALAVCIVLILLEVLFFEGFVIGFYFLMLFIAAWFAANCFVREHGRRATKVEMNRFSFHFMLWKLIVNAVVLLPYIYDESIIAYIMSLCFSAVVDCLFIRWFFWLMQRD